MAHRPSPPNDTASSHAQAADPGTPAHELPMEPLTVRIPTAVKLTGIGRSRLYELIASGDLEIVKIGSMTLIPVSSLRALIGRARGNETHHDPR